MHINRQMMEKAVQAGVISDKQAEQLLLFFKNLPEQRPGFNTTNVLYYFGGLLSIGAMSLFMNLGWELFGGWGIFFLSLCYAVIGLVLTQKFAVRGYAIPAGICATFVIFLTPLAIYGLQKGLGVWPDDTVFQQYNYYIKWHWVFMELGTLACGLILAWIYRYPFMIMPIGLTLWYMSMDLTAMITGDAYNFQLGAMVSMYFGLGTLLIAFWVDLRSRQSMDYAYWLYLFGMLAFWGGLSSQYSDSELSKFAYLCINLLLVFLGVLLARKVFVLFGAIGTCMYVGHLAYQVFQNSVLFPFVLTVLGFAIIYLGILWQRYEQRLTTSMRSMLPKSLQELLQARED